MKKHKSEFKTPVLFVIYRRKDTAVRVIEAIAKIKPKKLYISQDGPKNLKQLQEIKDTLKAILSRINWKCDLTVWTHDKNLGLKKHIPEALDKFFKRENRGIYLEDDTLPSIDFFYFEEDLLEKYKNDERIFSINATNYYPDKTKTNYSYYLSKIGDIWGFGLWRRSWKLYSSEMNDFHEVSKTQVYKNYFFNKKYKFYLETFWKAIISRKLDSWAMQLVYTAVKNNMYFISPSVNMVNNIGKGKSASNISVQKYYQEYGTLFPMKHPRLLEYSKKNDIGYFSSMLTGGWFRLFLISLYLLMPEYLKSLVRKTLQKFL